MMRTLIAAFVLMVSVCAHALATGTTNVSSVTIEDNGWYFKPTWKQETSGPRVTGFLAFASPERIVGSNIVAIWYERPAIDGDPWSAKSWMCSSLPEALKAAKSLLSIPDDQDKFWGLPSSISLAITGPTPPVKDYYKGFFIEDPVAPLINGLPNRDVIVQFLKDAGYPVADVPLEKTDTQCMGDNELLARAKASEPLILGTSEAHQDQSYFAYNAVKAVCAPPDHCGPIFYCQSECDDPTESTPWGQNPGDGTNGCAVGCVQYFRWLTVTCHRMRGRYCRGYAEFCREVASYRVLQTLCRCNPTTPPDVDTPMIIDQPMVISPETPYPPVFHDDPNYTPCRRRNATNP